MTKERRENESKRLYNLSTSLKDNSVYLQSRAERRVLAGIYKQFMHLNTNFPQMPANKVIPTKLEKKVSASCGACEKPQNMKLYISSAITFITKYGQLLYKEVLSEAPQEKKSVHDLRPTFSDDEN